MDGNKHKNYELLNLIGYGLAKFDTSFVKQFGFNTKQAFYDRLTQAGIAETTGTIKNRQDLFDPFFDNRRKGWWQKGNTYLHRKTLIDSLFGSLGVKEYADVVNLYIEQKFQPIMKVSPAVSPILQTKFKQLQTTGREAELYFMQNFQSIPRFNSGLLEDARLFGDGFDFQVQVSAEFYLAEIKGVRASSGSIRLTKNEYEKAKEYKMDYVLIVVSNLFDIPKMTSVFDPIANLSLSKKVLRQQQITYNSSSIVW